jgi:hypothetical protein
LFAHHQRAPPRPVLVGEVAVGVKAVHQPLGQLGHLVGAKLGGQPGQMGLGLVLGLHINTDGQPGNEIADHPNMPVADPAGPLRRRGRGQPRRQRLTGQRPPLAQIGGLGHPPAGQHRG